MEEFNFNVARIKNGNGEFEVKTLSEALEHISPIPKEQRELFKNIIAEIRETEIPKALNNVKKRIEEGAFSEEELQGLLTTIENKLKEISDN